MENRRRKFQESSPLDDSNGAAPKRSRRDDEGTGAGNELPRFENETRVMPAFQTRIFTVRIDDCRSVIVRLVRPHPPDPPETLLDHVLSCFPVVSGVLGLLSVERWLILRRVSKAWKNVVDIQLRSLKVLDIRDLLGKMGSVKIPLVLRLMSKKAPALREICCNRRIRLPESVTNLILLEMKSFKRLTVLNLSDFYPIPTSDAGLVKALDLLERLAEQLETLSLPRFNWKSSKTTSVLLTPAGEKSRLELVFSRLCALRRLHFGYNNEGLHDVLMALPRPEKLQRLVVDPISDTVLQFLQRCSELTHLELVLGHRNIDEQLMATILSQLQTLTSLVTRRRPGGIILWVQSLKAISGLQQLVEWQADSDALPGQAAVSWGGWGFRSLSHLRLSSVAEQCHLDALNQIPSLVTLQLQTTGAYLRLALSLPLLQSLSVQAFGGAKTLTFDLQKSLVVTKVHLSSRTHTSFCCLIAGLLRRSPRVQELRLDLPLTESKSSSIARNCPGLEILDLDLMLCLPWLNLLQNALPSTLEVFVKCCPLLKMVKMPAKAIRAFNLRSRFPNVSFLPKKHQPFFD